MGIVLTDATPAFGSSQSTEPLFQLQTGDLLEVKSETPTSGRVSARARVDVFLAATTQLTESAGSRYPDRIVWIPVDRLQILPKDQAVEYTQHMDPITLGNNDPTFSTYDFYLRAMKNPDRTIHRIVGARLVGLVSLHDEYSEIWTLLNRDLDPEVRSLAMTAYQKQVERRHAKPASAQ